MLWVAAAGPVANLVMALLWALALKFALVAPQNTFTEPLWLMAGAGITVNLVLMLLNLLPILPLDGGRIAVSLLPNRLAYRYSRLEPYGFPILLLLLFTHLLDVHPQPGGVHRCMIATIFHSTLGIRRPCTSNASSPACAPPGACTWAIITARSRTGSSCKANTPVFSSLPTGMR